jgi:DNA-binding transcriptional ArsR family regulator
LQATPEQPYLCVRLDIDTVALAEQARHLSTPPADGRSSTRGVFVGHNSVELLDPVLRLLRLLESPRHLPALAPLALQEILYRLLSGPEGWRLAQTLTGGTGGGSAARIAQAIHWLRERYAEPLSIAAMAEAAHMSPSSLHHHFKAVTAMGALPAAGRRHRCGKRRTPGRLPEPLAVQPRIQPHVRRAAGARSARAQGAGAGPACTLTASPRRSSPPRTTRAVMPPWPRIAL